jgi:hypothetical protein
MDNRKERKAMMMSQDQPSHFFLCLSCPCCHGGNAMAMEAQRGFATRHKDIIFNFNIYFLTVNRLLGMDMQPPS